MTILCIPHAQDLVRGGPGCTLCALEARLAEAERQRDSYAASRLRHIKSIEENDAHIARLGARLAMAELALNRLLEATDDSDGCQYGTLSTSFVRDVCNKGLRATDSETASNG